MKYSEPFYIKHIIDNELNAWHSILTDDNVTNLHIFDINGMKLFLPEDIKKPEDIRKDYIDIVFFLDYPVFTKMKNAYKFIYNVMNCIWKEPNDKFFYLLLRQMPDNNNLLYAVNNETGHAIADGKVSDTRSWLKTLFPEYGKKLYRTVTEEKIQDFIKNH